MGTGICRTTSYQPHTAFPQEAIAEETEKSSQAGRNLISRVRA